MTQPNINERILVDTSDEDSQYDAQSIVDSNVSLASSVRDYNYENGRRYHAYRHGQYPIPNDEEEQDRLAVLHHLFKLLTGGDLYRAPLAQARPPPSRILDIGTGTGIWALEMAEDFPQAEIVGTDLSPIQPNWAPPNCKFFIDDVESDWTFTPAEAFDYIHARSMGGGIGDWNRLLHQAYQHLRPGGWLEVQEFETWVTSDDETHHNAVKVMDWLRRLDEASLQFGRRMNVASNLRQWMEAEGFVNVTDDMYKCPIGSWPKSPRMKEIGNIGKIAILEAVEPYTLALFTRVLGYTYEEARDYVAEVRTELLNNSYHLYVLFHYVYGQKPMNGREGEGE